MKLLITLIKYMLSLAVVGLLVVAIGVYASLNMLFDEQPAMTEFPKASLEDIKRIKHIAIEVNRQFNQQGVNQLTLSERDINLGLGHFGPTTIRIPDDTYARINLTADQSNIQITLPASYAAEQLHLELKNQLTNKQLIAFNIVRGWVTDQWLNANWDIQIDNNAAQGQWLTPGKLTVGAITLSDSISQAIAQQIISEALAQPGATQITSAWENIKSINHLGEQLTVEYTLPSNGQTGLNSYQSLILTPDEQQLVATYEKELRSLPKNGPLVSLIAPLFEIAQRRSNKTSNPAAENRAALLALAKYFGGDELGSMLNMNAAAKLTLNAPPYTIYGRRDLAQHLVLSAGLTLVADEGLAELIGLDKEISDLMGGKTISAWDLLADKAGVRLAQNATQTAKSARRVQIAIAKASKDTDILPDLGADFSYSGDRFSTEDIDELATLVELYLEELDILKK